MLKVLLLLLIMWCGMPKKAASRLGLERCRKAQGELSTLSQSELQVEVALLLRQVQQVEPLTHGHAQNSLSSCSHCTRCNALAPSLYGAT